MDSGYKNAVSAIIDANVTTIIAAAVLWWQGTGTIISFAKTLLIGVVLSHDRHAACDEAAPHAPALA